MSFSTLLAGHLSADGNSAKLQITLTKIKFGLTYYRSMYNTSRIGFSGVDNHILALFSLLELKVHVLLTKNGIIQLLILTRLSLAVTSIAP